MYKELRTVPSEFRVACSWNIVPERLHTPDGVVPTIWYFDLIQTKSGLTRVNQLNVANKGAKDRLVYEGISIHTGIFVNDASTTGISVSYMYVHRNVPVT